MRILILSALLAGAWQSTSAADFRIDTPSTEIRIELDPGLRSGPDGSPWLSWIETILDAARKLTGSFPEQKIVVELVGASRSNQAVVFGQVRRSGPPRIIFYVNPDAALHELQDNWRGYHEFAHLLIPFPGNQNSWFSEGFASYYQYLLQSRSGRIEPEEAWRRLLAGLQRGLDDPNGRGRSLRQLSPEMWRERAFRRVYWTGASFFLRIDTRLRIESGGRHSIDSALAAFHDCCMQQRRRWSAEALVKILGQLSLPAVWEQEYRTTLDSVAQPRFDRAMQGLGIEIDGKRLHFSNEPDAVALRHAIAGPRPTAEIEPSQDMAELANSP